jgi:hypothetical protein
MVRRFLVTMWIAAIAALLVGTPLSAQENIVAEGVYGSPQSDDPEAVRIRSTIIQQPNGDLVIRITGINVKPHAANGVFGYRVSKDWKLLGYMIQAKSDDPINAFDVKFSCTVDENIDCTAGSGQRSLGWYMKTVRPLILYCCEQYVIDDLPFGATIALMSTPHVDGATVEIPLIMVTEEDSGPKLKVVETEHYKYLGKKPLSLGFGNVQADVFETKGLTIWLAPSGLLLATSDWPGGEPRTFQLLTLDKGKERFLPDVVPHAPK